jgi:hypothetical protein
VERTYQRKEHTN